MEQIYLYTEKEEENPFHQQVEIPCTNAKVKCKRNSSVCVVNALSIQIVI